MGSEPLVPAKIFFTKGVGRHAMKLQSFELALRAAGIERFNLVKVSSIFPPGCKVIPKKRGFVRGCLGEYAIRDLAGRDSADAALLGNDFAARWEDTRHLHQIESFNSGRPQRQLEALQLHGVSPDSFGEENLCRHKRFECHCPTSFA